MKQNGTDEISNLNGTLTHLNEAQTGRKSRTTSVSDILAKAAFFWVGNNILKATTIGATCHDPDYDGPTLHSSQIQRTTGYLLRERLFREVVAIDAEGLAVAARDDDSLY